jgi:hypothetical protein
MDLLIENNARITGADARPMEQPLLESLTGMHVMAVTERPRAP